MDTISFYSTQSRKTIRVEVSQVKKILLKNGRWAAEAIDPESGRKMYKILGTDDSAVLMNYEKSKKENSM
jgi:hypothetical protein